MIKINEKKAGVNSMEKKILTDMERIEKNRRIAEAYYAAYDKTWMWPLANMAPIRRVLTITCGRSC